MDPPILSDSNTVEQRCKRNWHSSGKKSQKCIYNQSISASLKIYNRELSSTIDRYQNGENAYIYLEQSTTTEPKRCIERFAFAWLLTVKL
jgi:hypothetical protein